MLNKQELVKLHAELNQVNLKDAEREIVNTLETLKEAIKRGGFNLVGYLKAEIKETKERSGEMTKADGTKVPWTKPAGKAVKVTPGSKLKGAVE